MIMITAGADSWRDQSSARSSGKSCHCLWIHPSRSWRVAGDHDDGDDVDEGDDGDDDDDSDDCDDDFLSNLSSKKVVKFLQG